MPNTTPGAHTERTHMITSGFGSWNDLAFSGFSLLLISQRELQIGCDSLLFNAEDYPTNQPITPC